MFGEKKGFQLQIKLHGEWQSAGEKKVIGFLEEARYREKWYKEAGFQTQILRLDLEPTPNGKSGKVTAITVERSP
jgi:hypothetical protein